MLAPFASYPQSPQARIWIGEPGLYLFFQLRARSLAAQFDAAKVVNTNTQPKGDGGLSPTAYESRFFQSQADLSFPRSHAFVGEAANHNMEKCQKFCASVKKDARTTALRTPTGQ